jgi:hypothetical protein
MGVMRPQALRALCLVLLASIALSLSGQAQSDSPVALFKKYYGQYKDTPSRVEAVLTLEGVEDPQVFELLFARGKDKSAEPELVRAVVRVLAGFKNEAQLMQVFDALKAEKTESGKELLLRAVTEGKHKDRNGVIAALFADKEWTIRRMALKCVLASSDASCAPQVLPLCEDAEAAVKGDAIDALAGMKSELVVPKAITALNDPTWQVRASAIKALTLVRHKDAVEPLIQRLIKEDGRLVPDIAEALANLTGQEIGPKPDEWLKWWGQQDKTTYIIPTPEGIAFLRGKKSLKSGQGQGWEFVKSGVATNYNGIQTASRQMIFVIDCSGSMEALVTEKERFEAGNYPGFSRMAICKTELARTIERLDANVRFNIIWFATDVGMWKKSLQPANILNKSAAKDWVMRLEPIGGSSKEDLASVGLAGAANLDKGKTNTFGAIKTALGVNDLRTQDQNYKVEADTVFFLSDGRPTAGEYVDADDILREIKAINELRKVVLHTIAIGEFQKEFMKRLADQNGGVFVDLGK